jgi:hypothetical protein
MIDILKAAVQKGASDLLKRNFISMEDALAKANRPELIRGGPPAALAA